MVCHLQYFNVAGYFNSQGYVSNMGIDLQRGNIFGAVLNESDKRALEQAIAQSYTDSTEGKLPGIVNLIQLVESMQDKYGVAHDHKHPTDEIVKSMCSNADLVRHYGLEGLAHKLAHQHGHDHVHTHTHKVVKTKTR